MQSRIHGTFGMRTPTFRAAHRSYDCLFNNVSAQLLNQQRTFSSSAICRKSVLPKFTQTSSPELDDLLSRLRTKLFLPAILSPEQQKLIYKSANKTRLETDPVNVTIGDETLRLEFIDRAKDLPRTLGSLVKIADLMKDQNDWSNLPSLLQGFQCCKRIMPERIHVYLIRKAEEEGRLDVIIECAKQVSKTGFTLQNRVVATRLIRAIHRTALCGDWEEIKQAVRRAEIVSDLMVSEAHVGRKSLKAQLSLRHDLIFTGRMLELAAVKAKKHQDGKDEGWKVALYARDVLRTNLLLPDDLLSEPTKEKVLVRNHRFIDVAAAVNGLQLACSIIDLNSELGIEVAKKVEEVLPLLQAQGRQILKDKVAGVADATTLVIERYAKLLGFEARSSAESVKT